MNPESGDRLFDRVVRLAFDVARRTKPAMKWTWGEALLAFSLVELDSELGSGKPGRGGELLAFAAAYLDHWLPRDPRVDQADTLAPALAAWSAGRALGSERWRPLVDKALGYIREGPRAYGEALNHLGRSPEGRLYPSSVWVDSLMMLGVFPARYARDVGDAGLLDFAARQPRLYADLLMDPGAGLWSHSRWTGLAGALLRALPGGAPRDSLPGSPYPRQGLFWARGNGWVVRSLPLILDCLPEGHPEREAALDLYRTTSESLLGLRRGDGRFGTLLDRPGMNYPEASATALIAGGWMAGLARGWLSEDFREPALASYRVLVESLEEDETGLHMPGISAPTIPLPLFPYLGYACVPRRRDYSYGLAALILAAVDYRRLAGAAKGEGA